ncbi:hypothetical protein PENSPDRAFT_656662 [Peniophora sp. CONT]|nr:hypothetical protein PENSPDRAFT_656662 [Peniophora sp. CONT]
MPSIWAGSLGICSLQPMHHLRSAGHSSQLAATWATSSAHCSIRRRFAEQQQTYAGVEIGDLLAVYGAEGMGGGKEGCDEFWEGGC